MAAFKLAAQSGADGIELDVHLSRDGIPVVIHDETVDRTTDGRGDVSRRTVQQLQCLDAGGWFGPDFAGERIPTLAAVLQWAGGRLRLNIEIKSARALRAVMVLLPSFPHARILVSSFNHPLLEQVRMESPHLSLGFLTDSSFWRRAFRRAVACGAESFHPREDQVSLPLLRACHEAGMAVYPWTVDEPSRMESLRRLGVDGLFTNRPGLMHRRMGKDDLHDSESNCP